MLIASYCQYVSLKWRCTSVQRHFRLTYLTLSLCSQSLIQAAARAASGRRRWPICWCCLDRGPGSFDVEDATTLSWSSAAVSEWVSARAAIWLCLICMQIRLFAFRPGPYYRFYLMSCRHLTFLLSNKTNIGIFQDRFSVKKNDFAVWQRDILKVVWQ